MKQENEQSREAPLASEGPAAPDAAPAAGPDAVPQPASQGAACRAAAEAEPGASRDAREDRAAGALYALVAGSSLGCSLRQKSRRELQVICAQPVLPLALAKDKGYLPGQPADECELAFVLARCIQRQGCFRTKSVESEYRFWLSTNPPEAGHTTQSSLAGVPLQGSISNGALQRAAAMGLHATTLSELEAISAARRDCAITHVHRVCQDASAVLVCGIRKAVLTGIRAAELYDYMFQQAEDMHMAATVLTCMRKASLRVPRDFITHMGYALIALQNALHELLFAQSPAEGIIRTISRGGDAGANASICGALLGAVYGASSLPSDWIEAIDLCRPEAGACRVPRPRPFWPSGIRALARDLCLLGQPARA